MIPVLPAFCVLFALLTTTTRIIPAAAWNSVATSHTSSGVGRILADPSFQAFKNGTQTLCCVKNVVSRKFVRAVLDDATTLQHCGFGMVAGISNGPSVEIRRNTHQTWLRSAGSKGSLDAFVGNVDARDNLIGFVESLRFALNGARETLPSTLIELSYLSYQPGAFYAKHIDCIAKRADERSNERCVSLLLYLGDPGDRNQWNCAIDGGALQISGEDHVRWTGNSVNMDGSSDIEPQAGTLVLFDSVSVPHEVLRTCRSRVCVVGWFGKCTK